MKHSLLVQLSAVLFFSCHNGNQSGKGGLESVKEKYGQKYKLAEQALMNDTANYATANIAFYKMKFAFNNTIPGDPANLSTGAEKKAAAFAIIKDTIQWGYFREVLEMPALHPALLKGEITVQDPANRYV